MALLVNLMPCPPQQSQSLVHEWTQPSAEQHTTSRAPIYPLFRPGATNYLETTTTGMSTSGLLYAASRLNSPSRISSDVFNTWYNDIHVRDVLKTSGINSAARYETAAVPQDSSPWTFLALYPVPDLEFLKTEEFSSIPVTSDVLPGPTHSCMDIAHFDIRRYREVGIREDSDMPSGPMSHLLTVEFDLPSHIDKADDQAVMDWFCGIYSSNGAPQRVAIHEVFQAMLFPDGKPAEPPRYLALLELNGDDNVYDEAIKKIQLVANVGQWKVHKVFD